MSDDIDDPKLARMSGASDDIDDPKLTRMNGASAPLKQPPPRYVEFSKGSTVYGSVPSHSKSPQDRRKSLVISNVATDSRATRNRLVEPNGVRAPNTERNVPGTFVELGNRSEYIIAGVPIGTHDLSQPAFQKGIDGVVEQFKLLRALGKQPTIDVTGLASSSSLPGKGGEFYARERANELKTQLVDRGVPSGSIRTDTLYGPYQDPRSISFAQKALDRGATIKLQEEPLSDYVRPKDSPSFAAKRTYRIAKQTASQFTDSHGAPTSTMYYFAKLYEIITKYEIELAEGKIYDDSTGRRLTLRYPDFLLTFIPVFYDMYKSNLDRFVRNRYDDKIAPRWWSYFRTISDYDDKSNAHLPLVILYGVSAHINGDMAEALERAYRQYSLNHPGVRFDDFKGDFFEINRIVFDQVLVEFESHLAKIHRPLDQNLGESFDKLVLRFGGSPFGSWLNDSFSIDDVFQWRKEQWQRAKSALGE